MKLNVGQFRENRFDVDVGDDDDDKDDNIVAGRSGTESRAIPWSCVEVAQNKVKQ